MATFYIKLPSEIVLQYISFIYLNCGVATQDTRIQNSGKRIARTLAAT
jgi:hypothetical protein